MAHALRSIDWRLQMTGALFGAGFVMVTVVNPWLGLGLMIAGTVLAVTAPDAP